MAINLKKVKRNVPRVRLEDYMITIGGMPKSGKTTFFANLTNKYFNNEDKALLIAFEKGYQALEVNAVDINRWEDFEDVVSQLLASKDPDADEEDKLPFEYIGIDTVDVMWQMAEDKVVRDFNKGKEMDKRAKTLKDIPWGQGNDMAYDLVNDAINKLRKAGYGIMALTHSKERKIEQRDGSSWDVLDLSVPKRAREIFVNLPDFLIFLSVEKTRNEDGDIENKRYLYLRSDGYVEAGSRFTNVPEKIEYDVDLFLETFKEAIESAVKGRDVKQLAKEQAKEREEEVKKAFEEFKPEELKNEIMNIIKAWDTAKKKDFKKKLAEELDNDGNFKKFDDIEDLKRAKEIAKEMDAE